MMKVEAGPSISEYERGRNEQIARNNAFLATLGLADLAIKRKSDGQSSRPKRQKGAAPSRASNRQKGESAPEPDSPLYAAEAHAEEHPVVVSDDDLERLAPWLPDFARFLKRVAKSTQRDLPGQAKKPLSNNNYRKTLTAIIALVEGAGVEVGFGSREHKVYHRYHPAPEGEALDPKEEPWTERVDRTPRRLELTDALEELHKDCWAFERFHSRGKKYDQETDKGWTLRHPLNKLLEFRESTKGAEWASKLAADTENEEPGVSV